jgi:hypothetical protein
MMKKQVIFHPQGEIETWQAARAQLLKGQSFHILCSRLFLFEFKKNYPYS